MSDQENASNPSEAEPAKPGASKAIPVVPAPVFRPTTTNKAIYCFPPGTSEADKQHDIEQVNLWIEYIKAKRKAEK